MRRLSAETAETPAPDAAADFGPGPGTPGGVGAVARRSAAWRDGGRPKPRSPGRLGRRPPVEDNSVCPPGHARSKPQTSRAGRRWDRRTCGFTFPECFDAVRH